MNFYRNTNKSSSRVLNTAGQNVQGTKAAEGPATRLYKPLMRKGKEQWAPRDMVSEPALFV